MNVNDKILPGILVVVVLLGGWYALSGHTGGGSAVSPVATTTEQKSAAASPTTTATKPAPAKTTTTPTTKKPTATTATTVGIATLQTLFGMKQSLICAVKTMDAFKRSGTMYVADGQMRVNFVGSSMIDDGKYLYAWKTGAAKGLQLLASSSSSGSAMAYAGGFDLGTNLSYSCNPWIKDVSVFAPPTSISFSNSL